MKNYMRLLVPVALFVFLGAGCLGGGDTAGANGGFFVSVDSGKNWTASSALPTASGVSSISNADITAIEIDPSDTSAYYLGTVANGMLFSYDSGTTWQRPENESARSGKVVDVEVDPRDICTVYVLKSSRVLKSTTCGRTFDDQTYVESRSDESLTSMTVDWYNPNVVYITSTAGDVLRSTDAGKTWASLYRADDQVTAFTVSNADSRVLLVGTRRHGLLRSTDGGATWTEMEDPMKKEFKNSDKVYAFAQTADGGALYMTSAYGIVSSSDNGATWKGLSLIPSSGEVEVSAIGVDPTDGNNIFFSAAHTLYHSVDGGLNWTTSELPTTRAGAAITVDPENAARVMLGVQTIED